RLLRTAQGWLNRARCDLLIWGRVKASDVLSLRFTTAQSGGTDSQSYKLTETLELPTSFVSDLGTAIAARVVAEAAPAIAMEGHYLVPVMRRIAERLAPIIQRLNPAYSSETRGWLLHSYALVRSTIGEQAGSNQDLEEAANVYNSVLKEWPRERMP